MLPNGMNTPLCPTFRIHTDRCARVGTMQRQHPPILGCVCECRRLHVRHQKRSSSDSDSGRSGGSPGSGRHDVVGSSPSSSIRRRRSCALAPMGQSPSECVNVVAGRSRHLQQAVPLCGGSGLFPFRFRAHAAVFSGPGVWSGPASPKARPTSLSTTSSGLQVRCRAG